MLEQGKTLRRIGPYSRDAMIAKPKRRTMESRFLEKTRADLTSHVGGTPTPTQKLMIERIAMTLLRIELMDRDALRDRAGILSDTQTKNYLAWSNTVSRMLRSLGLEAPEAKVSRPDTAWPALRE